jgi:hypothetical protein
MRRISVALAALVVGAGLAACEGGGGELAQNEAGSTPTTVVVDGTQPVPADDIKSPQSAKATAKVLARVERELRDDERDPAALRELGRAQQLAYRSLARHPEWVPDVIAAVPAEVREAIQTNVAADASLAALTGDGPLSTGFPSWEIRSPQPAATLRGFYDEAEVASGVPWAYLAAIHLVETRMGRIRGLSSAGAQGPMQFIPETWARYGEGDINDDRDAILAAGRYLEASNFATNMDRAIFSYNNDDRYVAAIKAYATVMLANPLAYDGYYHWQVFFTRDTGTFLLPEGFTTA